MTAAPAYAASQSCRTYPVQFALDGGRRTSSTNWSRTRTVTGTSETITLTSSASYTSGISGDSRSYTTFANAGGLGGRGLWLAQTRSGRVSTDAQAYARRGTYTFTFSKPVTNLRFTLTDIDNNPGDYRDRVALSPGFVVEAKGSSVANSVTSTPSVPHGAAANPFRPVGDTASLGDTSSAGNVRVLYAGPVTTFSIEYWNREPTISWSQDGTQWIFLAGMSFDREVCA